MQDAYKEDLFGSKDNAHQTLAEHVTLGCTAVCGPTFPPIVLKVAYTKLERLLRKNALIARVQFPDGFESAILRFKTNMDDVVTRPTQYWFCGPITTHAAVSTMLMKDAG